VRLAAAEDAGSDRSGASAPGSGQARQQGPPDDIAIGGDLDAMFVDSGQACHHHSRGLPGGSAPFTTQGTSAAATASLMVKHAGRPAPATQ